MEREFCFARSSFNWAMSPASWFFNLSALAIFMGVLSVFGFRLSDCQMVVRRGNAPRSSAYQAGALLLSYRTHRKLADGVGIAPTQPGGSLGFRDRDIAALPTIRNGQGGRSCTCDLLVLNLLAACKRPSAADVTPRKKWRSRKESRLHPRR